jgi:hypothetical protein
MLMTTLPAQFICFCPESPYCLLFTAVGIRLWRENSCNHIIALLKLLVNTCCVKIYFYFKKIINFFAFCYVLERIDKNLVKTLEKIFYLLYNSKVREKIARRMTAYVRA